LQEDVSSNVAKPINLMVDATFFGREYGFLAFHDGQKIIYFKEIKTESVKCFKDGLVTLMAANYRIISITVDGRRGYVNAIKRLLGNIPVQMCLFHQKAIVRRYITDKPQSQCGMDLKDLMHRFCKPELQQEFIHKFYHLQEQYYCLLQQKNDLGHYKYNNLRAAFRSIDSNMFRLFLYSDIKDSKILPTINHLEGFFGHLKERIKIHRGLDKNRKKRAIKFMLNHWGKNRVFSHPFF